jgi:hypothetical protein
METPEFLIWAIEYTCPIRGLQDGSDPERTERQLRAARTVSDARCEDRVFEGLCVDPPNGFRVEEALQVYGDWQTVENTCRTCPANALLPNNPLSLAGCYGVILLPKDLTHFHAAIDRATQAIWPGGFKTSPAWYGLWHHAPYEGLSISQRSYVLRTARDEHIEDWIEMDELLVALATVEVTKGRLHVKLFPRGHVDGNRWYLVPHCQHCKAEWSFANVGVCGVCRRASHSEHAKKRHARGLRPYFPLARLLGEQQATEFLLRYLAFRARRQLPDQVQNQPRPKRPDSPPAG